MLVLWLDEPACQQVALTGGKAASLSRLAAQHPVPPAFCLTTEAYRRWRAEEHRSDVPRDVRAAIAAAYQALAQRRTAPPLPVAVRSSAVGEDGRSASFAGQYATYLNVRDLDGVLDAVYRCWTSMDGDQVRAYHQHHGGETSECPMAVLVQQLIPADVAFVAFSRHPVTGARDEVIISANWGLGESIVNGSVVPDTYLVRKLDCTVIDRAVAEKQRMTVLRDTGVQEINVPRMMRNQISLSDQQAAAIGRLVTELEADLGYPVDVEGAYLGDTLFLLQCRPISTLS